MWESQNRIHAFPSSFAREIGDPGKFLIVYFNV